mgnify:CR=1 FL=1
MSTVDAHAGAQSRASSSPVVNSMRTGTRCTTFTQLPLAFCGGRIANCAPVPGLTDATTAVERAIREACRRDLATGWPDAADG